MARTVILASRPEGRLHNIRNANTRKAYARAADEFAAWCDSNGLHELRDIEPMHVATYIETLQRALRRIAELYDIEADIRGRPARPATTTAAGTRSAAARGLA